MLDNFEEPIISLRETRMHRVKMYLIALAMLDNFEELVI
jgi:hypothetical protein